MTTDKIFYIHNPSKVPIQYKKYLHNVVVEKGYERIANKIGKPPKKVLYHSHYPTFVRISRDLQRSGVTVTKPLYGYMLGGIFYAIPGVSMW